MSRLVFRHEVCFAKIFLPQFQVRLILRGKPNDSLHEGNYAISYFLSVLDVLSDIKRVLYSKWQNVYYKVDLPTGCNVFGLTHLIKHGSWFQDYVEPIESYLDNGSTGMPPVYSSLYVLQVQKTIPSFPGCPIRNVESCYGRWEVSTFLSFCIWNHYASKGSLLMYPVTIDRNTLRGVERTCWAEAKRQYILLAVVAVPIWASKSCKAGLSLVMTLLTIPLVTLFQDRTFSESLSSLEPELSA